jgi:amidase
MDDLVFRTATELARLMREKSASAQEVLEAHLRHIAAHNPGLNAIVTPNEQEARQRGVGARGSMGAFARRTGHDQGRL